MRHTQTFTEKWDREERINESTGSAGSYWHERKTFYKKWWFWVLVVILVYILFEIVT